MKSHRLHYGNESKFAGVKIYKLFPLLRGGYSNVQASSWSRDTTRLMQEGREDHVKGPAEALPGPMSSPTSSGRMSWGKLNKPKWFFLPVEKRAARACAQVCVQDGIGKVTNISLGLSWDPF